MRMPKALCSIFASLTLGFAATSGQAQDAPTAAAPALPPIEETINTFRSQNFFLKDENGAPIDTRAPLYLCPDSTKSCLSEEQRRDDNIREFQLMMQATVYSCRQYPEHADLMDSYNAFVTNHQSTLQRSFHTVAAYFTSRIETPRDAMLAQEALETKTGNMYSVAANSDGYCAGAGQILRHVGTLDDSAAMTAVAQTVLQPLPPR